MGPPIDMSEQASRLAFHIICMILYGDDLHGKMGRCIYEDENGDEHEMELHDALEKTQTDCNNESIKIQNIIFPQLVFWNIGSNNKRNYRNALRV